MILHAAQALLPEGWAKDVRLRVEKGRIVEVTTGVVRAVLMTVCAESFDARNGVAMVASAVPAKSKRGLIKGVLLVVRTGDGARAGLP